ncbi:hypothetical protein CEXT_577611 [Caerostris extrusa]|uniref:Uncharacterized protein n=1 Tax=Caerostris extrusa TaxID=172846 RepID=A0AAV4Q5Z5_CAEEX|nr:hypothetical protein CEXT_577611 [Caerostris extrusa]
MTHHQCGALGFKSKKKKIPNYLLHAEETELLGENPNFYDWVFWLHRPEFTAHKICVGHAQRSRKTCRICVCNSSGFILVGSLQGKSFMTVSGHSRYFEPFDRVLPPWEF